MRSSTPAWLLLGLSSLCVVTVGACARVAPQANAMTGGSGGSGGSSRPGIDGGVRPDRGPTNIPMQCGDGVLTQDEACDDGNAVAGDGCAADCLTRRARAFVHAGREALSPRRALRRRRRRAARAVRRRQHRRPATAARATCKVELGLKCSGSPSMCTPTRPAATSMIEGAESCDDGNAAAVRRLLGRLPERARLQDRRAACPVAATASSSTKHCDDGNNVDGDGCSADLQDRARVHVQAADAGRQDAGPGGLPRLPRHMPAGLRAGRERADDGAHRAWCKPTLDADGKPVYTGHRRRAYVTSAATFAQWYRDTPGVNHTHRRQADAVEQRQGRLREPLGPERRAVAGDRAGVLLRQRRR